MGLATAMALAARGIRLAVLEAESEVARHQSGRNSGVIHSGLYYQPGSLKARLCAEGREAMYAFCAARGIPHRACGKLVVATSETELPRLEELGRRGRANGLEGLERLDAAGIRRREPEAAGIAGLWVPQTGVVDFAAVTRAFGTEVQHAGGEVRAPSRLLRVRAQPGALALDTASGPLETAFLINCAGLESDRVARLCGVRPAVRIVPFRGDYYEIAPERRHLVRGLLYPVPDPELPFLGVHLTRTIADTVEAGPTAVLAFRRAGYRRASFSLGDAAETLFFPGFWRLIRRHGSDALGERWRAASRGAFLRQARRLVPALAPGDLRRGRCGVRAQAVARDGSLMDDFHIEAGERSIHVLNAPSPGATASIAIGRHLAALAAQSLGP